MNTKKIVFALALAAVTPAVLSAQENGNAYNNQNHKEVIAANNIKQEATMFGPEGKILTLSDMTLAKIRARRANRDNKPAPQAKTKTADTVKNTAPDYYPYGGREGHMMALENLNKNKDGNDSVAKDIVPTYIKEADTLSRNHQVNLGGNDKELNKSAKQRNKTFRSYIRLVTEAIAQEGPYTK